MGGGISRHALAVAVSEAGGLGTIAVQGAEAIERELAAAQRLHRSTDRRQLILHFARPSWFRAADKADVVVTFWGKPRRRTSRVWFHQAGSIDGGPIRAGGRCRRSDPARCRSRRACARTSTRAGTAGASPGSAGLRRTTVLAGGIAERSDVVSALAAGAPAAVAGTRFLLSPESGAHPVYKAAAP